MLETYRSKIKEIENCLKSLDESELSEEVVSYLEKGWASLMIACAHKYEAPNTKHKLVITECQTDSKGNMQLILSSKAMDADEQVIFDKFMFACKSGEFCSISSEDDCAEKYKEISKHLT